MVLSFTIVCVNVTHLGKLHTHSLGKVKLKNMKNWWQSLSISTKLNIPIQVMLIVMLSVAHFWIMDHIKAEILDGAERRATIAADGIINGMNMLMITGMISDPEYRRLFIKKMSDSADVKELRIIRSKQVQDQYGPGLPEEQVKDELDRLVITSKHEQFLLNEDSVTPTLRVVVPFIASENFRGTNCLSCHQVESGSVNGAASITIDMSKDFKAIRRTQMLLWLAQIALHILLLLSITWLIRKLMRPIVRLQTSMQAMQNSGSMETFVPLEVESGGQDEIGKLTATFNQMSATLCDSEKSMKLAAIIYQANANAIVVTDENNRIVQVNPAFTRITGYTHDEVIGRNPGFLKSGRHDAAFYREMWHAIVNHDHWQGEIWDRRKDGAIYAKSADIIMLRNADGSVYRYVGQFSDITEQKEKAELTQWQAHYDPLTNLPNRRLFHDRLRQAIKLAHRNQLPLALLFIDLDHFKQINDSLGHHIGDALLMEAARRMCNCVRQSDTVSRLAGDEFTIILPDLSDISRSSGIAANIVEQLALPFYFLNDETAHHISASIGIALYPQDADSFEGLLKCADKAMYAAKGAGRDRYFYFSDSGQ